LPTDVGYWISGPLPPHASPENEGARCGFLQTKIITCKVAKIKEFGAILEFLTEEPSIQEVITFAES
jgi:hypothetical protein